MSLAVGTRLGPYEVLAFIGAGGMGEVYKATDIRLGRTVAIKILAHRISAEPARRMRLEREAKIIAGLSHPHICTLYDVGEYDGSMFLVMEHLEGETLAQRLARGPLRTEEALTIAAQTAEAISAAHRHGIIHRDLKPANVMLTAGGVKLVDFGIAKAAQPADAPTGTLTQEGAVVGTAAYMSPEQAAGQDADARSDVFSFGVLLYEMLTGQQPFKGSGAASVLASILRDDPPPLRPLAGSVPAALETLVRHCLDKDRARRWQSITDVSLQLEDLSQSLGLAQQPVASTPSRRWRPGIVISGALFLLVAAGAIAWSIVRGPLRTDAEPRLVTFTSLPGEELWPAISPDGNHVAFVWSAQGIELDLYVKLVGAGDPVPLTRDPASDDMGPAWSPDGLFIAFYRRAPGSATSLNVIPALGGRLRKVAESGSAFNLASAPAWSPDAKFLAIEDQPSPEGPRSIYFVSLDTGEKRRITTPAQGIYGDRFPAFSPDGRTVAFTRFDALFAGQVFVVPVASGQAIGKEQAVTSFASWGIDWTSDGRSLVLAANLRGVQTLWRVLVDTSSPAPERLAAVGDSAVSPSVARRGKRLVYSRYSDDWNIWRLDLGRGRDAPSPARRLIASTRNERTPAISPDGRRIAFSSESSGTPQIWTSDADGSNPSQLTNLAGARVTNPQWSADGRMIAFDALQAGHGDIYIIGIDDVSPRHLTMDASQEERPSWSWDRSWVYFRSNRTGRWEIWKTPVAGGPAVQVTRMGGYEAFESPKGTLYYAKRETPGLWAMSPSGVDTLLLDGIRHGQWGLSEDGIYWITSDGALHLYRFDTRRSTRVAAVPPDTTQYSEPPKLAVSSDGRWLLYAVREGGQSDVMLLENFR